MQKFNHSVIDPRSGTKKNSEFSFFFSVGKIQLILPYQGITVRSLINSSVSFTWRFSGDVAGIEFGFKATNAATIEKIKQDSFVREKSWLISCVVNLLTILLTRYSYFEKSCRKKCARDNPERWYGIWSILCSWHLSCRTYFCCFPFAIANICPWPLVPFLQISLKNSELKATHNTFRDCRVHLFRQPFSK